MAERKRDYLYGGSYDQDIADTAQQIQSRPAFNYDVDGDALYQQYKDRYTQNAKNAMKDTIGQVTSLTGGYGSSYAQGVGQQRYDETMRGLTDMIPTLEQNAYQRYQDQGQALQDRYAMLMNLGATERANMGENYNQIAQLISTSGYMPSEEELARAGMSSEQAEALRRMWMTSNPQLAYYYGQMSPEDYYRLTGAWPAGYTPPGSGGNGGLWSGGGDNTGKGQGLDEYGNSIGENPKTMDEAIAALRRAGASNLDIMQFVYGENGGKVNTQLGKQPGYVKKNPQPYKKTK